MKLDFDFVFLYNIQNWRKIMLNKEEKIKLLRKRLQEKTPEELYAELKSFSEGVEDDNPYPVVEFIKGFRK